MTHPLQSLLEAEVHATERKTEPPSEEPQEPSAIQKPEPVPGPDQALAQGLLEQDQGASVEEKLLQNLVAAEQPILQQLIEAQMRLALKVNVEAANPTTAYKYARVLREVVAVGSAINRRQVNVASTLVALRAQRQMLERARGRHD